MVIARLKQKISRILRDSGIDCADFETEQLLKYYIGESYMIRDPLEEISEETENKALKAAVDRAKGEPLQYILGEWDFYGLTFKVGEGVLIPRQETELLVEKVLPFLDEGSAVIDLCSGSGCIPIALARKSGAQCCGIEISEDAIGYFKKNNALNGTEDKVRIFKGDVLDPRELLTSLPKADLITANPPYLTVEEMENLQKEVRREPEPALYGGRDGLDFYRKIFGIWKPLLKQGGIFAAEMGEGQSKAVCGIMEREGFTCRCFKDYGGTERVVLGWLADAAVTPKL